MSRTAVRAATLDEIARYGGVAATLREGMARKRLSRTALRDSLEMKSNGAVWKWLAGKGAPSQAYAEKLSALLEVPVAALTARPKEAVMPERAAALRVGRPRKSALPVEEYGLFEAVDGGCAGVARPPAEVMRLTVDRAGLARLRLDLTLPLSEAAPLFRVLMEAGLFGAARPAVGAPAPTATTTDSADG